MTADVPKRFERIADLTREVFSQFQGLVYIAPAGVVVRAVAPCLQHKTTDPGVVVVDVGARWAVSLLGGHEGGANALAVAVANALGAEPVITTTTEAAKDLIVGVGCRRGTPAEDIVAAVHNALAAAGCELGPRAPAGHGRSEGGRSGPAGGRPPLGSPPALDRRRGHPRRQSAPFAHSPAGARESRSARRCRTGSLAGGKEDPITTPQDHHPTA